MKITKANVEAVLRKAGWRKLHPGKPLYDQFWFDGINRNAAYAWKAAYEVWQSRAFESFPVEWATGESIRMGDVVRCSDHYGVVFFSRYLKSYQVSVGTWLSLQACNLDRLEFIRRAEPDLCRCGRPFSPPEANAPRYCSCDLYHNGRPLRQLTLWEA